MADVSEVRRLAADLDGAPRQALPLIKAVVAKVCADTTRDAKANSPVATGFLRSSIGFDVTADTDLITGEVGPSASYGHFVEFGTARMPPQPYMGPAFEKHAPKFEAAMGRIKAGL